MKHKDNCGKFLGIALTGFTFFQLLVLDCPVLEFVGQETEATSLGGNSVRPPFPDTSTIKKKPGVELY